MTFSKVLRRTHMYLALFLFPWMLMYALSTLVMNHRAVFEHMYGRGSVPFEKEREMTYEGVFPENAEPRMMSQQILDSLSLDGAHTVNVRKDGMVVINRTDLTSPRRIIYSPADRKLVIEKMQHRPNALLERFHRRRGYETGYTLDTIWAVSVDTVIIAMIFWVLSGLWLWWEMKVTRALGAIAAFGGLALFGFYLATL